MSESRDKEDLSELPDRLAGQLSLTRKIWYSGLPLILWVLSGPILIVCIGLTMPAWYALPITGMYVVFFWLGNIKVGDCVLAGWMEDPWNPGADKAGLILFGSSCISLAIQMIVYLAHLVLWLFR